ncbi:hypothetical protein ENBRE01_3196 [Enteropsectra breve]|nr:hypothetical protein ENBRE01_3196 [Enteropsectra breve]
MWKNRALYLLIIATILAVDGIKETLSCCSLKIINLHTPDIKTFKEMTSDIHNTETNPDLHKALLTNERIDKKTDLVCGSCVYYLQHHPELMQLLKRTSCGETKIYCISAHTKPFIPKQISLYFRMSTLTHIKFRLLNEESQESSDNKITRIKRVWFGISRENKAKCMTIISQLTAKLALLKNNPEIVIAVLETCDKDVQTEIETKHKDVQTCDKDVQTEIETENKDVQTEIEAEHKDVQTEKTTIKEKNVQTEIEAQNKDVQTENKDVQTEKEVEKKSSKAQTTKLKKENARSNFSYNDAYQTKASLPSRFSTFGIGLWLSGLIFAVAALYFVKNYIDKRKK